jgi:ADP-heptose:LPS heptosyltransferase
MRIVVLVPGGIEEQLFLFPTLETLKQQYPSGAIDVIVPPSAKAAYRLCPHIHEVLAFDYRESNGLADYLNLLGTIRDREYDGAILTEPRWNLELLLWLNGIPRRIGYQSQFSWFLSDPVPPKTKQYAPYLYHDLVQGLEIASPCPPLRLSLSQEDIDWGQVEQKRLDLKESGYVLIYGGGAAAYPVEQWSKIIADIQQKQPNLPVVLLQEVQETQWLVELQKAFPALKILNPPDLGKLAAAIAGANLFLCTGGIPLILATAVGTYTVALLEPAASLKFLPPAQERYMSLTAAAVAEIAPEAILAEIWRG